MIKLSLTSNELMALFGHLERSGPAPGGGTALETNLSSIHRKVCHFIELAVQRFDNSNVNVTSGIGPECSEYVSVANRWTEQQTEKIEQLERVREEISKTPESIISKYHGFDE